MGSRLAYMVQLEQMALEEGSLNRVVFSSIRHIEQEMVNLGLSLKYVNQGRELYQTEEREYEVEAGQFLLVNHEQRVQISIQSEEPVVGTCLFIDPKLLTEAIQVQQQSLEQNLDNIISHKSHSVECFEAVYSIDQHPVVSNLLQRVHRCRQSSLSAEEQQELYWGIAEVLLQHEYSTHQQIQRIASEKRSTKEELYRRLLIAIDFMYQNFDKKISIREIATAACLSEYHFMRTFRQSFGQSPNQFLSNLRLQKAAALLREQRHSVTEVATLCGFSDVQYFSKTFRRAYNQAPSNFQRTPTPQFLSAF